jgi:hypothetical protein
LLPEATGRLDGPLNGFKEAPVFLPIAGPMLTFCCDLDSYVTGKALDGMFLKVGQEEAKIRTNPAARTTDLLKKVFAK